MTIKLPFDVPPTYTDLTVDKLNELETFAVKAAEPLRTKTADEATDEDVETLQALADVVASVRDERTARETRAEKFASASAATAPKLSPEGEQVPDEDGAEEDEDAKPAKTVTAGAKKAPRVANVAKGSPLDRTPSDDTDQAFLKLVAAADVPGFSAGSEFDGDLALGRAVEARLQGYSGRNHGTAQHGVAVIQRHYPTELRQSANGTDDGLIAYATDEKRLPGGSLVESMNLALKQNASLTAAAGWCAPSQNIYDLFEIETGSTGLVDVPEVQITRGGMNFTPGPDFASIFAGTGYFHQTEAQVIAATTKPCMVVPCPSFTDVRLEVEGVCITGAILQSRGYPEMVARFVRGAMAVHSRKMNKFVIDKMVAGSTVVDLSPAPVATSAVADDTSATTVLLSTLEMAIVDYRYRHRMAFNTSLEIVLPYWCLAVVRADLSRRTGVDMVNVTDAQIMTYFTTRGARVQWVYDWQDSFAGLATGPGGATALSQFPQELLFMVYAAGTWVKGVADVITLDTIYDAAGLALNQFTALFTEEGVLVAKKGHDSRVYTVPFCPTGATSATNAINCA